MVGGLPPAPRWAWVVMGLGVVAVAVMAYLLANRPPPPGFSASASAEDPAAADALRVLVVGDATTAVPEGAVGWPQLMAEQLAADGPPVELQVAAADGSGYLRTPPEGQTFAQLAEAAGPGWDVVVFAGSQHDNAAAADVQAAAEQTFAAARAVSPEADLLAVGPVWPTTPAPGYVVTNRDAVSAAAAAAGVPFADPLAELWLTGPDLVDDGQPTDEGHRYLADRIAPLVEPLVAAGP
ncbi:SGNH/GDSL hydrolase family protein [Blastococcus sp. SYSU DS0539]